MSYSKIVSFSMVPSHDALSQFEDQIKKKVEGESKEYILGVDEQEYKDFLIEEYSLEPLQIYEESESVDKPIKKKEKVSSYRAGYVYEQEFYYFFVSYTFTGSPVLFHIRPSSWIMRSH